MIGCGRVCVRSWKGERKRVFFFFLIKPSLLVSSNIRALKVLHAKTIKTDHRAGKQGGVMEVLEEKGMTERGGGHKVRMASGALDYT